MKHGTCTHVSISSSFCSHKPVYIENDCARSRNANGHTNVQKSV